MELVSIIIPTFNRGNSISRIIEKVNNQTYQNLELIMVNDGSTDETKDSLNAWALKNKRIKPIHSTNGGPSKARNLGIEKAAGEYIFFIDDDDDIPLDYIEKFMQKDYEKSDLVVDSFCNQTDNFKPVPINFEETIFDSQSEATDHFFKLSERLFPFFIHAKRFKTSIIRNNGIRFSDDVFLGEDRMFILDYLSSPDLKVINFVNNHTYIVRNSSQVADRLSQGHKPIDKLLKNFELSYDFLIYFAQNTNKKYIESYADNYLAEKIVEYVFYPCAVNCTDNEYKLLKQEAKRLLSQIDHKNIKKKFIQLIVKSHLYLGPSLTLLLIKGRFHLSRIIKGTK